MREICIFLFCFRPTKPEIYDVAYLGIRISHENWIPYHYGIVITTDYIIHFPFMEFMKFFPVAMKIGNAKEENLPSVKLEERSGRLLMAFLAFFNIA